MCIGYAYKPSPTSPIFWMRTERILDVVSITRRFQITLTKPVRETLKVGEGDRVLILERDGEVIIRKA